MIKKEVFIGFFVGVVANLIGLLLAVLIFGNGSTIELTIKQSIVEGFFAKLLSMGALLNLVVFFIFIKNKKDYRARGVLLATVLVAVSTFLLKLF
jgi:Mg/Co/Ni transporter MgtE